MTNKPNKWAVGRRIALIKEFGGRCSWGTCMEEDPDLLEFAHMEKTTLSGRGRGRKERLADINANRKSYRLLCKTHHDEFDDESKIGAGD